MQKSRVSLRVDNVLITYQVSKKTKEIESTIRETGQKQYFSTELQNNIKKTNTE